MADFFWNQSELVRTNQSSVQLDLVYSLPIFGCLLVPVIVVGTMANTMVIVSILRNKKLRNESINHLIVSLCVADYIILLLDRPILTYVFFTISSARQRSAARWCYAESFFESFGMAALLLNLAILSFERFLTIRRPLEAVKKKRRIAHFITLSWMASMACGIGATLTVDLSYHLRVCQYSIWFKWGYFDYLVIPLGAVTTVFIALMYALIMRMVRVHVSSTSNSLGGKNHPNLLITNVRQEQFS
jgi:7 transmembrane receptor (rhodopsin family)